tara:strand:- start:60 stop:389 length:330 start_codon:yes stop_codon:yes gene_type:complete
MTITKNNIKLEGNGFLPHDTKNYRAYFENGINFVFSKDKLVAVIKDIEINGAITDYRNSFFFFTDENIIPYHARLAKKDLQRYVDEPTKNFDKKVEKFLKKEKLWQEEA